MAFVQVFVTSATGSGIFDLATLNFNNSFQFTVHKQDDTMVVLFYKLNTLSILTLCKVRL